jgi:hypothetical protein
MILSGAPQYPTNVRPPTSVARRVRISWVICVRVMYTMRYNPLNRPTFESHRAARRQKVFNYSGNFITAMSQESVIAHPDAETSAHPIKNNCRNHRRPAGEKERCNRSRMRDNQENSIGPIDSKLFSRPLNFATYF